MIFAQAHDDGSVPDIAITAVASVEPVAPDRVRVSYYRVVSDPAGASENRIVARLLWDAQAWLGMRTTFERAREAIEDQRAGVSSGADARAATRQEAMALIGRVGGAELPGESVKARDLRTAGLLGWDVARVEDVRRGDARRIEAHEIDQLRAAAAQ